MEVKVLEITDSKKFEEEINFLLKDGFQISSTSCGFVNSEQYDFCSSYQAILVRAQNQEEAKQAIPQQPQTGS